MVVEVHRGGVLVFGPRCGRCGRMRAVGPRLRVACLCGVVEFDALPCMYCLGKGQKVRARCLDHLIPSSKGGRVTVPACMACNRAKGSSIPEKRSEWLWHPDLEAAFVYEVRRIQPP